MSSEIVGAAGNVLSSHISLTTSETPVEKLKEPGWVKTACRAYVPLTALVLSGREIVIIPDAASKAAVKKSSETPNSFENVNVGLPQALRGGPAYEKVAIWGEVGGFLRS